MRRISLAVAGLFLGLVSLFGQSERWRGGIIIPVPPIEIRDPVHLLSENAKITINDAVVTVKKEQLFKNSAHRQVEGKYVFPLPNEAFINEFSLYIDNERINGEILPAQEAKKIFEEIVRKYRDPALLEMIGNNLFQASIFPFAPFGERKIEIKYTQMLKPAGKTYRLLYPISFDKRNNGTKLNIEIEINSASQLANIYSPSHDISIESISGKKVKVKVNFESGGSASDLLLYYSVSDKDIEAMNLVYDDGKENPYFMLRLAPKLNLEQKSNIEKNVIFVLDISGSMTGKKIEQAKNALTFCMNNLNKNDNFSIVTFSNSAEEFITGVDVSNQTALKNADKKVKLLEADGGTNLNQAVELGLKKTVAGKPNYLILFTDGLPTVGVRNPDEIAKNIRKNMKSNVRIFCFGVGNDVDAFLLDKIATDYRGSSNYVRENEDLENEVSAFFAKISNPVLTDCKIDFNNLNVYDTYPKELPDLFAGSSIMVFGRMNDKRDGEIILSGYSGGEKKRFTFKLVSTSGSRDNVFVANLWANRKIAFLLDEIRNRGENKELVEEVVKLSKKYGIITPYTSYLVTEEERKSIGADRPMIKKDQLYDAASGYTPLSNDQKESMVNQSITLGKMKSSSRNQVYQSMKNIDGKVFIMKDEYWVDAEFDDTKCKEILSVEFASDEYFALADNNAAIIKYLSLSDKVKFVYQNKCYVVK